MLLQATIRKSVNALLEAAMRNAGGGLHAAIDGALRQKNSLFATTIAKPNTWAPP